MTPMDWQTWLVPAGVAAVVSTAFSWLYHKVTYRSRMREAWELNGLEEDRQALIAFLDAVNEADARIPWPSKDMPDREWHTYADEVTKAARRLDGRLSHQTRTKLVTAAYDGKDADYALGLLSLDWEQPSWRVAQIEETDAGTVPWHSKYQDDVFAVAEAARNVLAGHGWKRYRKAIRKAK